MGTSTMDMVVPNLLAILGGAAALWAAIRFVWEHRRPRRLCPGPRLTLRQWLLPTWLIHRMRCGYDLGGHIAEPRPGERGNPGATALVACPECGRAALRRQQLLRSVGAWRPMGIACLCWALAISLAWHPPIAATSLVAMAPTDVLLTGEGTFGSTTPIEIRDELRRRAMDHQFSEGQIERFVALLVHDLRDDALIGNAKAAMEQLAIFGLFNERPLYEALESGDHQQRSLVAELLRDLPRAGDPPAALLRVSVEDLRADDRHRNAGDARSFLFRYLDQAVPLLVEALDSDDDQQRTAAVDLLRAARVTPAVRDRLVRGAIADLSLAHDRWAASGAFSYLVRHADIAEPLLGETMVSGDRQARLLAAAIAGCTARTALMQKALPILISHCSDNQIANDGIMAARAIAGFGTPVVPLLQPWRDREGGRGGDEQCRQTLEYIVARLTTTRSVRSLQAAFPLARLTVSGREFMEIDPQDLSMPRFPR